MVPKRLLIYFFLIFTSSLVFSQDTTGQIFTPLVDEVISLNAPDISYEKVKIANLNSTKINEAPGSVYVITSEEIERNGYRDLLEVFADIPGFNVATDVQNGTGIGIRGAWAAEAKMLVMIDGLIMNDMAYGSFVLGGRIPLLNVERIEIIKGAGSSIYGGIAGLGVINIVTKDGNTALGTSFLLDFGVSNNAISGTRLTFANTTYLLNDFEVSLSGSVFTGNRSNVTYEHPDTTTTSFKDSSNVTNAFIQMRLKRKNFEYKILYDDYNFQASHEPIYSLTRTFINDINFEKKFNNLRVNFNVNIKDQTPWNTQYGDPTVYDLQNLKTRRITAASNLNYRLGDNFHVLFGGLYYNDFMRFYRSFLLLNNNETSANFHALAAFAEIDFKSKFVNIYAGGRLDFFETFDPNFSPRLSLTKEYKWFHYKLIYGQSFKIPTLQNINLAWLNSSPIRPEKINDFQLELGIRKQQHQLKVNGFYTTIDDVIVYGYDIETYLESYVNNGNVTFAGFEVMTKNVIKDLSITSSYSFYEVISSDETDFLADTSNLKAGALAMPKHKLNVRLSYPITENMRVGLNYIFLSARTDVEQIDANTGDYGYIAHKPLHLVDLIFQTKSIFKYFDVTAGVKNVLNSNNILMYPMSGGYPIGVGMGREFFVQLKVNL